MSRRAWPLWAPWSVMALLVVAALLIGAPSDGEPPSNADRVLSLTRTIKCPQCGGQSVAESDVSASRGIRRDIATRVEQGQTDEQIRAYYASSFGDDALLTPPTDGVAGLVWLLPAVVLGAGAIGVGLALRRWSAGEDELTDEDRLLVADALEHDGQDDVADDVRG